MNYVEEIKCPEGFDWHFDKLKAAGFAHIDCFWRCDCDAIYGGIVSEKEGL